MKKVLLALVVCMLAVNAFAGQLNPKFNIDFGAKTDVTVGGVTYNGDTDSGFGFGAEYLQKYNSSILLGAGFEYQFQRKLSSIAGSSTTGDTKFQFMPVYLTIKLFPKITDENLKPYGALNLGYNFIYEGTSDYKSGNGLSGKMYYALGAGAVINKKYTADLMYSVYKGTYGGRDASYTKVGISAGCLFDVKDIIK